MPNYNVYDQNNQHINTIVLNDLSDWSLPDSYRLELAEESPIVNANKIIGKLDFLLRFTIQERVTIRSSSDPMAQDFISIIDLLQEINLEDPNIVVHMNYFENTGILTEGRVQQILAIS